MRVFSLLRTEKLKSASQPMSIWIELKAVTVGHTGFRNKGVSASCKSDRIKNYIAIIPWYFLHSNVHCTYPTKNNTDHGGKNVREYNSLS